MTIQDKDCCGTSSNTDVMDDNRVCSDIGSQSGNTVQMKENYSSGDENTPKARKPYTITKQRERWTEEEHSKFLEALRLYGRAWRRIEEHIGSKTAVQIRSHAQKFFSKVVRESGSDDTGSVKPIEIPPPRPKRKPVHPYPRKLVNSKKRNFVSDQIDRSVSPNLSVSGHENGSPTSVLSAPGSEVMGSTLSDPHRCSQSPSSSGAGSKPDGSLSTKQDNGSPSSSALPEEENGSSCGSVKRQSSMEHDFYPKDAASEGGHVADAPTVSLKLFGKTVLVTDSHRPSSSSSSGTARSSITENEQENCNKNDGKISETSHFYSTLNNCMVGSDISSWSPYNPSVYCTMPFQNSHMNHMEASAVSLHCWAMYGSFPYPYMQSNSIQMPALEERAENQQELRAEKSADSFYIEREISSDKSEKEVDLLLCLKPSKAVESTAGKMNSRGSLKGFVPYKRCYTENNGQSMGIVTEEKDGQRIRLCL